MASEIPREGGRGIFGRSGGYASARPDYPERVFELLVERCGLGPGCRTLDVGAGSGLATRELARRGARPVVAVEPDAGFAAELAALGGTTKGAVEHVAASFDEAPLEPGSFDLVTSATAFHWLDPERDHARLGACLRPAGWLALFWNVFGDPRIHDPFHEATLPLMAELARSPTQLADRRLPFSLETEARVADLRRAGAAEEVHTEELGWTLQLDPAGVRALYATFSPVAWLGEAERTALLDRLAEVAERDFGGVVERRMVTPLYLGRRPG